MIIDNFIYVTSFIYIPKGVVGDSSWCIF